MLNKFSCLGLPRLSHCQPACLTVSPPVSLSAGLCVALWCCTLFMTRRGVVCYRSLFTCGHGDMIKRQVLQTVLSRVFCVYHVTDITPLSSCQTESEE
ncbi:hypothetical protein BaRGS_00013587 [Batillaria attramentaria]|uniref:Secreted protein n=1 Tax=Batillaria attramentaria TaxID=370345 RepID=A0ABD0L7M8_9CAEN